MAKTELQQNDFNIHIGAAPPSAPTTSVEVSSMSEIVTSMSVVAPPTSVTVSSMPPEVPSTSGITSFGSQGSFPLEDDHHSTSFEEQSFDDSTDHDNLTDGSSEEEDHLKSLLVRVEDGPVDRVTKPKHYIRRNQKDMMQQIDLLKTEIQRIREEQKAWFECQFNEIKDQIRLITAGGLARALRPILPTTSHSHVTSSAIATTVVWTAPVTSFVTCQATSVVPSAPVSISQVTVCCSSTCVKFRN